MQLNTIAVVLTASTFLLGAFFLFLYRLKRQEYLLAWSAAWLMLSVHYVAFISIGITTDNQLLLWLGILNGTALTLAALSFLAAARLYAGSKFPGMAMAGAAVVGVIWAVAHAQHWVTTPPVLGVGLVFLYVGYTFWQEGRKQEAHADVLLAITFAGWGLLCILALFQSRLPFMQHLDVAPLILLPQLFTCVLMVMAVYEEERRRVERNMLALSSLNLATSSFVGGEIQKMLAQALERVLNVVRIPAGALCLQHGESTGPTSIVVTGLNASFCQAAQQERLDENMIDLVARL